MKQFKVLYEELKKVSKSLGSNDGGVYHDDETGEKHYIKFPSNPDQARAEVLSGKIHSMMGIHNLKPKLKEHEGKVGVSTKWKEDLSPIKLNDIEGLSQKQHRQLGKIFAHGVLTKNWDSVGTGLNYGQGNIHKDSNGDLHNIDPGGSFHFRAQGGPKKYDHNIDEYDSLRNPEVNHESAHVFNTAFHLTPDALKHAHDAIKNLDDNKVEEAFKKSGLRNWEELHNAFKSRKEKLLEKLGKYA